MLPAERSRVHSATLLAILAPILAGTGLLIIAKHDPLESSFFPPCVFFVSTGWLCPGCGSTRMLHELLNGHLVRAFSLNPATFLLLPILSYEFSGRWAAYCFGASLPRLAPPSWLVRTALFAYLCFWMLRNVPTYPFSLLAP